MRWKKLGKILSVENIVPKHNYIFSHVSVPVVENIENSLFRLYFSSRDMQSKSRTYSVIIDINNPFKVLDLKCNLEIDIGGLGAFDEDGAMGSCIVEVQNKKFLYYIGWNKSISVPFRNSIGLAIKSKIKFEKIGSTGLIMDRDRIDPYFLGSMHVVFYKEKYHMFYLSCTNWQLDLNKKIFHRYLIKKAESLDGIEWHKKDVISINYKSDEEIAISRPFVIFNSKLKLWEMWYSFRNKDSEYRIGVAHSSDLDSWTRVDSNAGITVSNSGFDSRSIEYPCIVNFESDRFLFYNGNNYGETGIGLAIEKN